MNDERRKPHAKSWVLVRASGRETENAEDGQREEGDKNFGVNMDGVEKDRRGETEN